MNTKGLRKRSGYSFEEITQRLEESGIWFFVYEAPHVGDGYFRSSRIELGVAGDAERAREMFGLKRNYCFAVYEIPEGFDFSAFDGSVRFDKGRFVERTQVLWTEYRAKCYKKDVKAGP